MCEHACGVGVCVCVEIVPSQCVLCVCESMRVRV